MAKDFTQANYGELVFRRYSCKDLEQEDALHSMLIFGVF